MEHRTAALLTSVWLALGGCGGAPPATDGVSDPERHPRTGAQPGQSAAPGQSVVPGVTLSRGWTVTVYYTAVVDFHRGRTVRVAGCLRLDCERGADDLGTYPETFVTAVKDEGTGRIAAGRYLNWSHDTGYWLDTEPRDTAGRALSPWQSAAADRGVLRQGARFRIAECGHDEEGAAIDRAVCGRLAGAQWTVVDEFTPGLGGDRHVDVYIGEETGPGFKDSPLYTTLKGASLAVS